jgi:hypothetical protein
VEPARPFQPGRSDPRSLGDLSGERDGAPAADRTHHPVLRHPQAGEPARGARHRRDVRLSAPAYRCWPSSCSRWKAPRWRLWAGVCRDARRCAGTAGRRGARTATPVSRATPARRRDHGTPGEGRAGQFTPGPPSLPLRNRPPTGRGPGAASCSGGVPNFWWTTSIPSLPEATKRDCRRCFSESSPMR